MYTKIMVPLDGSPFSELALPLARMLARRTGADLHLVTVLEPFSTFDGTHWESATLAWGTSYLEGIAARLAEEVTGEVTFQLLTGRAAESLRGEAQRVRADVTIMATHGRGAVARAWLGSVADEFARTHDGPVLLVRPSSEDEVAPEGRADLLVPLDGSELSEAALTYAVELGELCNSTFHLTRVVSPPPAYVSPYLPETVRVVEGALAEARDDAADYLEAHANRLRRRGFQVTTSVKVDAQPGQAILDEASEVGADFIVMATHGYRGLRRAILGSTADKVVRGTQVPVLLYRPAEVLDSSHSERSSHASSVTTAGR